ncbi:hypothetical protein H5548_003703 [Salmonella enterica]|nr:hypothetical protein [Salmonella enterica]EGP3758114.1 hypothetical protein [Salmonella enterica]EGP3759052.1 hypothetical protein [Salmonella enterica]EIV9018005.1 hypothetical protein [Salmonella enterica]
MGCKYGGECEDYPEWPGSCKKCGNKILTTVTMGSHKKLPPNDECIRIALIGHGTYHISDHDFLIPSHTKIYFKGPHGSHSIGCKMDLEYDPSYTKEQGTHCENYRLWPLIGEDYEIHSSKLVPYHHAHWPEHTHKFYPGCEIYMYSERSGDGPRLSSIIGMVRNVVGQHIPLEFVWLACREILEGNKNNYTVQENMVFTTPPIRAKI